MYADAGGSVDQEELTYMYTHIHSQRERERERERDSKIDIHMYTNAGGSVDQEELAQQRHAVIPQPFPPPSHLWMSARRT